MRKVEERKERDSEDVCGGEDEGKIPDSRRIPNTNLIRERTEREKGNKRERERGAAREEEKGRNRGIDSNRKRRKRM